MKLRPEKLYVGIDVSGVRVHRGGGGGGYKLASRQDIAPQSPGFGWSHYDDDRGCAQLAIALVADVLWPAGVLKEGAVCDAHRAGVEYIDGDDTEPDFDAAGWVDGCLCFNQHRARVLDLHRGLKRLLIARMPIERWEIEERELRAALYIVQPPWPVYDVGKSAAQRELLLASIAAHQLDGWDGLRSFLSACRERL